ncbi:hypothetical protein CR513_55938, partial [Mucuna pruriens]
WLSERGELIVDRKVLVTFSIQNYGDEVMCDIKREKSVGEKGKAREKNTKMSEEKENLFMSVKKR